MVNPIPKVVRVEVWGPWHIRGAVMVSLLLQTILILVAPFRKRSSRKLVAFTVWSGYLLADTVAAYAVGQISDKQNDLAGSDRGDLLAFWAPFLLVHLGGPDTITALALEDNELWLRHLLTLIFQAGTTVYVFLLTLPENRLWVPMVLMFVSGCVKYLERTRSLYLASMDRFRDSMLKKADPGPNYAKLMEEYASKKLAKLPTQIIMMPEPDRKKPPGIPVKKRLDDLQVVQEAYNLYLTFRGMIVDLIFSFKERDKSRDLFNSITATSALRVIEVELNFIYDVLFTKLVVVHSIPWFFARSVAFACLLSSFALFHFHVHKHAEFHPLDAGATYALFFGAVALDAIALTMFIFSDRTVVAMMEAEKGIDQSCFRSAAIFVSGMARPLFGRMWSLWRPNWQPCPRTKEEEKIHSQRAASGEEEKKHMIESSSVLFRRWSRHISGFNLITYCLQEWPEQIHNVKWSFWVRLANKTRGARINWVLKKIGLLDAVERGRLFAGLVYKTRGRRINGGLHAIGALELVDKWSSLSREPLCRDLWKLIFSEVRKKSQFVDDPETARMIASARGNWVLQEWDMSDEQRQALMPYVEVPYDESLLLWHVATELLYNDDKNKFKLGKLEEDNHDIYTLKVHSKLLSDYMLYLLIMQPALMTAVAGIGKIRFQDTCAEAKRFFQGKAMKKGVANMQVEACVAILEVDTEVKPINVKGDRSKSVLFDASMLAKELNKLEDKKWEIISHVWVELLSHAASYCRGTAHAQLLSKGGELATLVWLLIAHFGIGDEFQITEGHARAKLLVGK